MAIAGLILAGGAGRRMGGADKALVMLAGRPLLAHVQARLGPQVAALALSANGPAARFGGFALPVLPDPPGHAGDGPLAGILAGLDWAADQGAQALLTCPVDTPFVPANLGARLLGATGGPQAAGPAHPAVAESGGRMHPGCALWPVGLRGALRAALAGGARRLGRFASDHGAERVAFAGLPDPFFNINTPEDLARAEAALSQTSPSPGPAA